MNLVVDIGNSRMKAAVFSGEEIIDRWTWDEAGDSQIREATEKYPGITKSILSSTRDEECGAERWLGEQMKTFVRFRPVMPTPLKNMYATPETLGPDRLAAAVGANRLWPGRNLMVVDFGTAMTVDVVTAAGEYLGGNIAPGVSTRFRALNHYTGRLPLVGMPHGTEMPGRTTEGGLIGTDTPGAISAGVLTGMLLELEGYIARLGERFGNIAVIFTGGEADYFVEKLKNTIFANYDLVLVGLNTILEYNAGKK